MGSEGSPKTVTIVGPKHAGKSSAGKMLAKLIGSRFMDLDDLIQEMTGKSPRALYEEGPDSFRSAELKAAEALIADLDLGTAQGVDAPPVVVAAGGGLVDNPPALAALRASGKLVGLRVSAATAWARVRSSAERTGSLPPFLRGDDPEGDHRALHERRGEAYGKVADFEVDAERMNPQAIAEEIAQALALRRLYPGRKRA